MGSYDGVRCNAGYTHIHAEACTQSVRILASCICQGHVHCFLQKYLEQYYLGLVFQSSDITCYKDEFGGLTYLPQKAVKPLSFLLRINLPDLTDSTGINFHFESKKLNGNTLFYFQYR